MTDQRSGKTLNTLEARRHIWQRLAITAREDGIQVAWDEEGFDEPSVRRLRRASKQVAASIDKRVSRMKGRRDV